MSNNTGPGYKQHPEHRITLENTGERVKVMFDGEVIADTSDAIRLQEASYPPVYYVPRVDVKMTRLARTDHQTYCPFKGNASYFSISGTKHTAANAVWSYEKPYDEVRAIEGRLAFYPDRVDAIVVE